MEKVKTIPPMLPVFWRFPLFFSPRSCRSKVTGSVWRGARLGRGVMERLLPSPKHDICSLVENKVTFHRNPSICRWQASWCCGVPQFSRPFVELKVVNPIPIGKNHQNWEPKTVLNGVPPRRWPGDYRGTSMWAFYHLSGPFSDCSLPRLRSGEPRWMAIFTPWPQLLKGHFTEPNVDLGSFPSATSHAKCV